MDGFEFVQMIEAELRKRGIPKEQFYRESGISSATMSQWRKRIYSPSSSAIKKVEEYFGVVFSIEQKEKPASGAGSELDHQLEGIDFALFGEVKDLTDSQKRDVLQFVKFLKQKE